MTYLASVTQGQFLALRGDDSVILRSTCVVAVSHYLAYSVGEQPLGRLLGQAIDGGVTVSSALWHPLRSPRFQYERDVRQLQPLLATAWEKALANHPMGEDDWYRIEIEKVLRIYCHALAHEEGILSVLEAPADDARGSRVRIPIQFDFSGT